MIWRACDLNSAMISSLDSKWQVFKVGMLIFRHFMKWNWRPLCLKYWPEKVEVGLHTGTFYARIVRFSSSYGGSTLNILILWLLILKKITFLMANFIKLTWDKILKKWKKSARGRHHCKIFKTNIKTLVYPLFICPQGCQGCQKNQKEPRITTEMPFCANI